MKGVVYLTGAGPGAEDLLTLKAKRLIEAADAILYDELIDPAILKHAAADCRLIFVGKKSDGKSHTSQERINRELARLARRHSTVVRLKGGDPLLFGRGAEEAAFLKKQKIRFEFVPGVSSPFGCAAYSGIPLTERTLASRVLILSGHHAETGTGHDIDWAAARKSADTLVLMMAIGRLTEITSQMLDAGWSGQTPAAIVRWGSWSTQQVVEAPLSRLAQSARESGVTSPAVVFVGPTVRLRRTLNWFEKKPLIGRKIYYTRPTEGSHELRDFLRDSGALIVDVPLIRVTPPRAFGPLDRWILDGLKGDWIFFTSANGVKNFFERLRVWHRLDSRALAALRVAAIGKATSAELARQGIRADFVPQTQTARGLVREFLLKYPDSGRWSLVLIRPTHSPALLRTTLVKSGASVTQLSSYETAAAAAREFHAVWGALPPAKGDVILFASSSMVHAFFGFLGRRAASKALSLLRTVSIGPETSRTLRRHGIRAFKEAATPSAADLFKEVTRS